MAYWPEGVRGIGECEEWASGFTGARSTNNVAEYDGIYEALKRALERAPEFCVFEVDPLLVAEQLNRNYACRSTDLQDTSSKCVDILRGLTASGQHSSTANTMRRQMHWPGKGRLPAGVGNQAHGRARITRRVR